MTNNHSQDYRTLGVEPGCTWKELQTAYRRLVQATHPDRFTSESRGKDFAEEKFKAVNRAFRSLANYRQRHGVLPKSGEPGTINPASATGAADRHAPDDATRKDSLDPSWESVERQDPPLPERTRNHAARLRTALLWVGIGVFVALVLLLDETFWTTSTEDSPVQNATQASANPAEAPTPLGVSSDKKAAVQTQDKFISIGSSMGEVYDIQGVPTKTENGLWHYGSSKIYFSKGIVSSWEQAPSHPLKAELSMNRAKSITTSFAVGSSKKDVRAVMGAPLFEYEEVWDYGASKVYFRNGKVARWENSSLRPLKLQR